MRVSYPPPNLNHTVHPGMMAPKSTMLAVLHRRHSQQHASESPWPTPKNDEQRRWQELLNGPPGTAQVGLNMELLPPASPPSPQSGSSTAATTTGASSMTQYVQDPIMADEDTRPVHTWEQKEKWPVRPPPLVFFSGYRSSSAFTDSTTSIPAPPDDHNDNRHDPRYDGHGHEHGGDDHEYDEHDEYDGCDDAETPSWPAGGSTSASASASSGRGDRDWAVRNWTAAEVAPAAATPGDTTGWEPVRRAARGGGPPRKPPVLWGGDDGAAGWEVLSGGCGGDVDEDSVEREKRGRVGAAAGWASQCGGAAAARWRDRGRDRGLDLDYRRAIIEENGAGVGLFRRTGGEIGVAKGIPFRRSTESFIKEDRQPIFGSLKGAVQKWFKKNREDETR